ALGTSNNNLTPAESVSGWIHGIMAALNGAEITGETHLTQLTLVIDEASKIEPLQKAILAEQKRYETNGRAEVDGRLDIKYQKHTDEELADLRRLGIEQEVARIREGQGGGPRREPTRITLALNGATYRYGAVTTGA